MVVKAIHRSFNAGEFSELMAGRTDIDRYAASMKVCQNYVSAPQGPLIPRSGTMIVTPVADETQMSCLRAFIFSNNDAFNLEFADEELRFVSASGLLTRAASAITAVANSSGFLQFTSAALNTAGAVVGEQVVLAGFPVDKTPQKVVARITAKSTNVFTLDVAFPSGLTLTGSPTAARVHRVTTPYTAADIPNIRGVQRHDTVYLLCEGFKPRKLVRNSTYSWSLTEVEFIDGPFLSISDSGTLLTPSATGRTTSGTVTSSNEANSADTNAFDDDRATSWHASTSDAWIKIDLGSAIALTGYKLHQSSKPIGTSTTSTDARPLNWLFEGSTDNTTWVVLDSRRVFTDWRNGQTPWFDVKNAVAYRYYRLTCTGNNVDIEDKGICIGQIDYRATTAPTINLTASAVTGINGDQGFLTTDVGRLIRVKDSVGAWHSMKITARSSSTVVTAQFQDAPLPDTGQIREWRLGAFSDTTGWPTVGLIFQNRLWLTGAAGMPHIVAASQNYLYETFSPTDYLGTVAADMGQVFELEMEQLTPAKWIKSDDRSVLIGTAAGEFAIRPAQKGAIHAGNVDAAQQTSRGSNNAGAVKVDRQILFAQKHGRTLREMAYVYESEGYKCPSMSMFAGHMGESPFAELAYAAEPYSIVWTRREDGSLIGCTYDRDNDVIGWHRHDLAGGFVESMSVLPSDDGTDDRLWLVVRRTVNGQVRRYIEYLTPFWTFGMTVDDAHYVDCAARYSGSATATIYGLWHLAGEEVVGLVKVSGSWQILAATTVNASTGAVTVPAGTTDAIIGLAFDGLAITNRLDVNTNEGSGQGELKRIHKATVRVWSSAGGKIGKSADELEDIAYDDPKPETPVLTLQDKDCVVDFPNGYTKEAYVAIKREGSFPLPLNVVAIMPKLAA
jgi:hypothetical protein